MITIDVTIVFREGVHFTFPVRLTAFSALLDDPASDRGRITLHWWTGREWRSVRATSDQVARFLYLDLLAAGYVDRVRERTALAQGARLN